MRTPKEALAWALGQFNSMNDEWYRYCLKFVRSCYDIPAKYPDAITAWEEADLKHVTEHSEDVPRGVPVFWRGGTWGHVALSAGDGWCWSNDYIAKGRIHRVRIDDITKTWGFELLGWTEDLNGQRVVPEGFIKPRPVVSLEAVVKAARRDRARPDGVGSKGSVDDVLRVEKALAKAGLLEKRYIDGSFGTMTIEAYRAWQKRLGYSGEAADGIPGLASLKALGRRHGFDVR